MAALDELKAQHASMWGSGAYERIAATLAPMHDELARRLAPQPGEHWLDVATGTGEVAMRAARAGAAVVGVDFAPVLIEKARRLAAEQAHDIQYDIGDAEDLPYPDRAFDVVVSAVGVVFAHDQEAAASELARVCRSGGRLGLTAWRLEGGVGEFFQMMASYQPPPPPGSPSHFDWGRPERVRKLLRGAFDLAFDQLDVPYTPQSGEAAWEEHSSSYGPTRTLVESLSLERREELHQAVVEFYERLQTAQGIRHSREYLLVLGTRR